MFKSLFLIPFILLGITSCDSENKELEQIKKICKESTEHDNLFAETYKVEVLKNALINPAVYGHLKESLEEFEFLFESSLMGIKKLNDDLSKKERIAILTGLNKTLFAIAEKCELLHLKLKIDSLDHFNFLDNELLNIKTEMTLVHQRTIIFQNLYLHTRSCGFLRLGPTIHSGEIESSKKRIKIPLESSLFSSLPFNKVSLDSSFYNGQKISLNPQIESKFTFSKVSFDSLKSGDYKIFGSVVNYQKGIEYREEFSKEFIIRKTGKSYNNP